MTNNRFIHTIKNDCCNKTTFIILCARKSNKRGYKNIPLTIIEDNKTLLDKQIETINLVYNNSEIIVISGFEHDKVVKHLDRKKHKNVRIIENHDYKSSNIVDGWRLGLNAALEDDTYIIHGDRIFDVSYIQCKYKDTHTFVHDYNKKNYDFGLIFNEDTFINMSYGLPDVWSEIFFISKKDFNLFRDTINQSRNKRIYSIDGLINVVARKTTISVMSKTKQDIKILKEL